MVLHSNVSISILTKSIMNRWNYKEYLHCVGSAVGEWRAHQCSWTRLLWFGSFLLFLYLQMDLLIGGSTQSSVEVLFITRFWTRQNELLHGSCVLKESVTDWSGRETLVREARLREQKRGFSFSSSAASFWDELSSCCDSHDSRMKAFWFWTASH